MRSFNSQGRLEPRKCVGYIRESEYKASYIIYVSDRPGEKAHTYIEVSWAALGSNNKKILINYAKKKALSVGINLVEIY
jgi:hypothetical protein